MRKIRGDKRYRLWSTQLRKDVPKGVCNLCGGQGKYKETFKYKNPVIHTCWKCKGTGNVKMQVSYIGENNRELGLWKWGIFDLISENESDYVIKNKRNELLQMPRELFEFAD